ncbi:MAG: flagellar hook-basal body complex protein [Ferribacterium limneticum]
MASSRGRYSNGQTFAQGQIVLANFTNPNGLQALGNNQWSETSVSGSALVGAPNTSSLGVLSSSTVEESNVDLTAELVKLITQQRNYQANAQSIKTQDQILQTLVNLR